MSAAGDYFKNASQDAEPLLAHFDSLNEQPPPRELEVLKRAGLIMAMTACETYGEDRVAEACAARLRLEVGERAAGQLHETARRNCSSGSSGGNGHTCNTSSQKERSEEGNQLPEESR